MVLAVTLCSAVLPGCAPAIRGTSAEAAKGATSGLTQESLAQLEDPQTRARIAAVLGTPEMQKALQELAAGLSEGVVLGLSDEALAAHVDKVAGRFADVLVTTMSKTADAATSPEAQARMSRFVGAVVASAVRAAAAEIPRGGVAPGLAEIVNAPELKHAIGEVARTIAHQGVVGSNEGMSELEAQEDKEAKPLGGLVAFFTERWYLAVGFVAVMMLAAPLFWLAREHRAWRKLREDALRRSVRVDALLRAIESGGEGADVIAILRAQILAEPRAREERATRRERTSIPRPSHA